MKNMNKSRGVEWLAILLMVPGVNAQTSAKPVFKEIIENIKIVSPESEANLAIMRRMWDQGPQTGSGFFRHILESAKGQAWTALHDYISVQLSASLVAGKHTHPEAARYLAKAMGDLVGWGDRAAQTFTVAELKDVGPSRGNGLSSSVYSGIDRFVPVSTDGDWPPFPPEAGKNTELRTVETVSPKAVKDLLMTRELMNQAATKTGNAVLDQQIADAKAMAVKNLTAWVAGEFYADFLIARRDNRDVSAALKLLSGPKFEAQSALLADAFPGPGIGPAVGQAHLLVMSWLGPEVVATVDRLLNDK